MGSSNPVDADSNGHESRRAHNSSLSHKNYLGLLLVLHTQNISHHLQIVIMKLLDQVPVEFNIEEVLKNLHIDGTLAEKLGVKKIHRTAISLIRAKVLYTSVYINDRNGDMLDIAKLESHVLAKNLEEAQRVFPYVITIGNMLEDEVSRSQSVMTGLCLDNMGDLALHSAKTHLKKVLLEKHGLGNLSHISPGQLDWPLAQQKQLFSLFGDVESKIGVRLNDSYMMIPRKSISGIIFPTEVTFVSCQLCPRENCISRQADYSESVRKSYGLDPQFIP